MLTSTMILCFSSVNQMLMRINLKKGYEIRFNSMLSYPDVFAQRYEGAPLLKVVWLIYR